MGKLYVVGIGPGNRDNMTIKADRLLKECDVIVGYTTYIDLIKDEYPGKEMIETGMMSEVKRCEIALERAKDSTVCVICSGDSSVYGMAGLLFELRGDRKVPQIEVVPGITAALSGGALLGSVLSHDFSVISLSDRLTDWSLIEKRLEAAAKSDMCIAIYNPASKGRPYHLKKACEILEKYIPKSRPCGVSSNIGRDGEYSKIMPLEELKDYKADMFCTIFIGNSDTKVIGERLVTPRGYRIKDE